MHAEFGVVRRGHDVGESGGKDGCRGGFGVQGEVEDGDAGRYPVVSMPKNSSGID